MKRKGILLLMNDAPSDADFDEWLHGPHMDEVRQTPGLVRLTRYRIVDGPPDRRRFVGVMESDDLDATLAWRASPGSRRSQAEADRRGIRNRYALVCEPVFSMEVAPETKK